MPYTPAVGLAFWYDLDHNTLYNQAFMEKVLGPSGAGRIQQVYHDARQQGRYPTDLAAIATTHRAEWDQIRQLQRSLFIKYFGTDQEATRHAFEDFGQGLLIDDRPERVLNEDRVHMMDTGGADPVGYHRWHASIRAIQTFDADPWWSLLATLVGLGWAIQSLARPVQTSDSSGPTPNSPIDQPTLTQVRAAWLLLPQERLDRQYDLGTGTAGYHPAPLAPV